MINQYWGMDEEALVLFLFDWFGREMSSEDSMNLISLDLESLWIEYRPENSAHYAVFSLCVSIDENELHPIVFTKQPIEWPICESSEIIYAKEQGSTLENHQIVAKKIFLKPYIDQIMFIFNMARL